MKVQDQSPQGRKSVTDRVEPIVIMLLRAGVTSAALLLAIGLGMSLVAGPSATGPTVASLDLRGILAGVLALQPSAVIYSGLVVLIITPVIPLAAAAVAHAVAGDRDYTMLSLAVLLVVLTGIWLGKVTH